LVCNRLALNPSQAAERAIVELLALQQETAGGFDARLLASKMGPDRMSLRPMSFIFNGVRLLQQDSPFFTVISHNASIISEPLSVEVTSGFSYSTKIRSALTPNGVRPHFLFG
jgi:hypothetical protein